MKLHVNRSIVTKSHQNLKSLSTLNKFQINSIASLILLILIQIPIWISERSNNQSYSSLQTIVPSILFDFFSSRRCLLKQNNLSPVGIQNSKIFNSRPSPCVSPLSSLQVASHMLSPHLSLQCVRAPPASHPTCQLLLPHQGPRVSLPLSSPHGAHLSALRLPLSRTASRDGNFTRRWRYLTRWVWAWVPFSPAGQTSTHSTNWQVRARVSFFTRGWPANIQNFRFCWFRSSQPT
jgi:hypothetical protein